MFKKLYVKIEKYDIIIPFCKRGHIMNDKIVIKGAKEHNLKNINVEIPRDKLVVFTGLSGSRKIFFSI